MVAFFHRLFYHIMLRGIKKGVTGDVLNGHIDIAIFVVGVLRQDDITCFLGGNGKGIISILLRCALVITAHSHRIYHRTVFAHQRNFGFIDAHAGKRIAYMAPQFYGFFFLLCRHRQGKNGKNKV